VFLDEKDEDEKLVTPTSNKGRKFRKKNNQPMRRETDLVELDDAI
jgi:hypothetical protein